MPELSFPPDFDWGACTCAFQTEGAWDEDGKGESVWDYITHNGMVAPGPNGDTACDFYHRYPQDIALMKELGLKTVRFSVAWPRIFPEGKGQVNQKGLDFYDRVIDTFLAAGISPLLNCYHFDHPMALEQKGGWTNRDMAQQFADYCGVIAKRYGDRVKRWMVMNEPWVFSGGVFIAGRDDWDRGLRAMHIVAMAHGMGATAIRSEAKSPWITTAFDCPGIYPVSDSEEDIAAAERYWRMRDGLFIQGVQTGEYPEFLLGGDQEDRLGVQAGDMRLVHSPLDAVGLNIYGRELVAYSSSEPRLNARLVVPLLLKERNWHLEVYPEAVYQVSTRMSKDYRTPLWITEMGVTYSDFPDENGVVDDSRRVRFLQNHMGEMHRAIQGGADIRGCHVWTIMDSVEWNSGFNMRFGMVYCDPIAQQRIIKKSGYWYRDLIKSNKLVLPA